MSDLVKKWETAGLIPPSFDEFEKSKLAVKLNNTSIKLRGYNLDDYDKTIFKTFKTIMLPIVTRMSKLTTNYSESALYNDVLIFLDENHELYELFEDDNNEDLELQLVELYFEDRIEIL